MKIYTPTIIRIVLSEYYGARLPVVSGREAAMDLAQVLTASNCRLQRRSPLHAGDVAQIIDRYTLTSYNGIQPQGWPLVSRHVSRPEHRNKRAEKHGILHVDS